jgi:hypothetical protein
MVSPIDSHGLDRLADHVAGLLDPAEDARVAHLVDTDPAWAQAYADLVAAQPMLDRALAGLGRAAPMPVDVADRLDTALAAQARTAAVVDLEARRRRRRFATAAAAVAAAVVLVFGGSMVRSALGGGVGTSALNSRGAGTAVDSQPQAAAPPAASGLPPVLHSGTDYTPGNLRSADARRAAAPGAAKAAGTANESDSRTNRLDDPAALSACLSAIVARYGGRPTLVDYARYQGQPAVVVVLATGSTRRVVAAGTSCGLPGAGPAELYSVTG